MTSGFIYSHTNTTFSLIVILTVISTVLFFVFSYYFIFSTPVLKTNEAINDEPEVCLKDELREVETNEEEIKEAKQNVERREKVYGEAEEDVEEDDSLGLEMRNTDSVFSELSELSRHYLESVDQGASVRGELPQMKLI